MLVKGVLCRVIVGGRVGRGDAVEPLREREREGGPPDRHEG
jgi:MOSC domain-containing protein YiiM